MIPRHLRVVFGHLYLVLQCTSHLRSLCSDLRYKPYVWNSNTNAPYTRYATLLCM
jgi:hypothetical protein